MSTTTARFNASDITPLVALYGLGSLLVLFGVIAWITAGVSLRPTNYLGASTGTDATAAAWLVVGSTATTIGTVALIAAAAAHSVIAYLFQRDTPTAMSHEEKPAAGTYFE